MEIRRRTEREIQSYQEGFDAGVKMCLMAIEDNHAKYKEMIKPILEAMRGEE